jgi:hypothetical protein
VIVLPLIGHRIAFPLWMLGPTAVFLLAPMLNDLIFHWRAMPKSRLLWYTLHTVLLYGSMLFISIRSSVTSAFGRSVFLVTPKEDNRTSLRQALVANRAEITFGVALLAISLVLVGSVLPVLFIAVPAMLCTYLALQHNRPAPAVVEAAPEPVKA